MVKSLHPFKSPKKSEVDEGRVCLIAGLEGRGRFATVARQLIHSSEWFAKRFHSPHYLFFSQVYT